MELGRYMIARRFVLFRYLQCHLLIYWSLQSVYVQVNW